jgi:16S rRNA (uracil1498-N3)-methyltransferase
MSERFFVDAAVTTDHATLRGAEAHHLLHVMRAKIGDEVQLFDGSGSEFAARVEKLGRSQVELRVLNREMIDRESPIEFTLAVALPKGDRQNWLVEKAVELGATLLVPLNTQRSVAAASASALERLRRTVIEASKQCGRNRLLEIRSPQSWTDFVQSHHSSLPALRLVAHLSGAPLASVWTSANAKENQSVIAAVGPEGGFTEGELSAATAAGWIQVCLGPRTLRVETAAVALAVWAAGLNENTHFASSGRVGVDASG